MATASNLSSWNWVVETLANFELVDPSVLMDLVKRTPGISDALGNNAREMISLRILESLFLPGSDTTSDTRSSLEAKIGFDTSQKCEDVLRHILNETSGSSRKNKLESSKWDVQPFLTQKRSSLNKYALQQLKEAILGGRHPLLASLKERSGLDGAKSIIRNYVVYGNEMCLNPGFGVDEAREDLLNRNLSPSVLVRNESATETNGQPLLGDHNILINGCDRQSNASKPVNNLKANSVSSQMTETIGESSGGSLQYTPTEELNLSKEPMIDSFQGSTLPDGCDNEHVLSKNIRQSCDHNSNESNPAKKLKVDSVSMQQNVNLNSVSTQETEQIEYSFGGLVQHVQKELCDLPKEPRVRLEDIRLSDGGHDEHVASKKPSGSCDCHANESDHSKDLTQDFTLRKQTKNMNSVLSQDTELIIGDSSGGLVQRTRREESYFSKEPHSKASQENRLPNGCNNEHVASENFRQCHNVTDDRLHAKQQISCIEIEVPHGISAVGQGQIASDFINGNNEKRKLMSIDEFNDKNEDIIQANAMHGLLSSHGAYTENGLEAIDSFEINLCINCNEGGQMLVCSSNSCPIVIHESCLGSTATFDADQNFYCPFCAYSRAISELKEAKRKALLARNNLGAFLGFQNQCREKKSSKGLNGSVQNQPREENLSENSGANNDGRNVNSVNKSRLNEEDVVIPQPSVPSVNDNLSPVQKETDGTNAENHGSIGDKIEGETLLQECEPPREVEEQEITCPVSHDCELYACSLKDKEVDRLPNGTNCGLTGEELEGQTLLQECEPPRELDEQQTADPFVHDCEPNASSFISKDKQDGQSLSQVYQSPRVHEEKQIAGQSVTNSESNTSSKEIRHESPRHSEVQIQHSVLNHQNITISQETSTKKDVKSKDHEPSASKYSSRLRKRKPQDTYSPSPSLFLRRKVIPWTKLEEETLKEGVKKFSNAKDGVYPWKKILEFGGSVFQNRNVVDLKDKWRNICKGSSKPKSKVRVV